MVTAQLGVLQQLQYEKQNLQDNECTLHQCMVVIAAEDKCEAELLSSACIYYDSHCTVNPSNSNIWEPGCNSRSLCIALPAGLSHSGPPTSIEFCRLANNQAGFNEASNWYSQED